MRILPMLAAVLAAGSKMVDAKAAFAHFMVSNAQNYTSSDWDDEIRLAKAAHIDAFALNTAYNQGDGPQYDLAFSAASSAGFKLFFSFDYAGNGPWPASEVLSVLNKYKGNGAHFLHNGKPFVSTFEGPESASDWISIKSATNCFLVPDWSSLGAKPAMELAGGVADGLFAWSAWPWGTKDMDTFVDASYVTYLSGKPYMMPVSPWFYTNLPGFNKNWLWRGDSLWADRWGQVLYVQPEWVEIISWNDYGESHYIGPIRDKALGAMRTGRAPIDYVTDMPHDGWREMLPFAIDMYVRNTTTIDKEKLVYWYRKQPAAACGSGLTTGNTASQLQLEFDPAQVSQDRVFYAAVLGSPADVQVTIGGVTQTGTWSHSPEDGVGLYSGSVPFNGVGEVTVSVGGGRLSSSGVAISNACGAGGLANWNAWVGSASGGAPAKATPTSMDDQVCINGTSIDNFSGICAFGCEMGYCPLGACLCTAMGKQREKPKSKGVSGYPAEGLNENYSGLCSFDCDLGYCPNGVCDTAPGPLTTPSVSPFSPIACTKGTGPGNYGGLCSYACGFGFCPRNICSCDGTGALVDTPPIVDDVTGSPVEGTDDYGLCAFACPRGYCPDAACVSTNTSSGGAIGGPPVSIDPSIWHEPTPIVSCIPPCVVILPPYTLPSATTISFPPITKTFTEMWDEETTITTVITVTFPPVTTTKVPVFNLNITNSGVNDVTYTITPSILPTAKVTITPKASATKTSDAVVIIITSTPAGTKPYPVINDQPTTVSFTSTSPAGPTCTAGDGCGTICVVGCSSCGLLGCGGICPGCGPDWTEDGGGRDSTDGDCVGPYCGSKKPDFDSEGNRVCQKDVTTTNGLCSNGNFPLWNPLTGSVSCDYNADQADGLMTECQRDLTEEMDKSVLEVGKASSCCPVAKRKSPFERRQAKACGVDPDFPNNKPSNGLYHSVFTCDYDKWPNVCANAKSAIESRGKPPILTYAGPGARVGVMKDITKPWYASKFGSDPGQYKYDPRPDRYKNFLTNKADGWGLNGCEVEEYPWGSGNPNRNPDLKKWDEQSVLRLIPDGENSDHGRALDKFYVEAGNDSNEQAKGLIYSISFVNGPSGTSDADFFIDPEKEDEAKKKNYCAIPYGVHFLFVHHSARMYAGERSYDPWWDNKLFDKTTYIKVKKGKTESSVVAKTVSHYCKSPSPGKSYWDSAVDAWKPHPSLVSEDRKRGNAWYSCDNYPGYSGPAQMRRRRGRRGITELRPAEVQGLARQGRNITVSDGSLTMFVEDDEDEDEGFQEMVVPESPQPRHRVGAPTLEVAKNFKGNGNSSAIIGERRSLNARQLSAGSFLDPSAFMYLGCGNSDEDHCVLPGADCASSDEATDINPDDDDFEPDPTTPAPEPTPTPTPEPEPAPAPTPQADCKFWDQDLIAYQFEIYNIRGWATDGGKGLHDNENGCGAVTEWTWEEATDTEYAKVHFNLPFFIKDGCVERAIKSAGGPKISCKGAGVSIGKREDEVSTDAATTSPTKARGTHTPTRTLVEASPLPMPTPHGAVRIPGHRVYVPMDWGTETAQASLSGMTQVASITSSPISSV